MSKVVEVKPVSTVKELFRRLAFQFGLKLNQRAEIAEMLGVAPYRISIWKQRDTLPNKALIILSIITKQDVRSIIGLQELDLPLKVYGNFEELESTISKKTAAILKRIASAYGFTSSSHANFKLKMRAIHGNYYQNVYKGAFPAEIVLQAHFETGQSLKTLLLDSKAIESDNIEKKHVNINSFEFYLKRHCSNDTKIAAKMNNTQSRNVEQWSVGNYIVIGKKLYRYFRDLKLADIDKPIHFSDGVFTGVVYSMAEYEHKYLEGRSSGFMKLTGVSRQAVSTWYKSDKVIVNNRIYSFARTLQTR
ncbi:hypothetical protein [Shewanella sp. UCD-KL12]|uniref:hypothetical protein n=1 Tax=Shewanella sp. UCD-KL12 TaxID=1917163 RepID=UPI0009712D2D|nr:hypothetical protein [Shewanella sp. UCD-KL12]